MPLFDFKHCTTWHKMWSIYYETLEDCLSFLCSEKVITKTEQLHRLVKMQNVRKCSLQDLQKLFTDYLNKISNFIVQALPSLLTKIDLDQAKCEIIEQNEVMRKQQHDELLETI